jgi:glucose/mannose-6-phosphate isomerase
MAEDKEILDRQEIIPSIDKSGMLSLIDSLPEMMEKGWAAASAADITAPEEIEKIVLSGMGGSAISGDVAAGALKDRLKIPFIVNRSYACPKFVDDRTLFIAVSYSGNTEETLASFKEALQKKANIICITSGGELKKLAASNKLPVIEVPSGLPPRAAFGYLLPCVLGALNKAGLAQNIGTELKAAIKLLTQLKREYGFAVRTRENPAKQLAIKLNGKVPVICASIDTTYAAALRWKTQLNENGKATVLFTVFPELNHNDMVNFAALAQGGSGFSFVVLRDDGDLERMKRRIETTKSLISHRVGGFVEVWSKGESMLERLLSLILFGDYLSVYLALLNNIDPTPVEIIEKLKKELQR